MADTTVVTLDEEGVLTPEDIRPGLCLTPRTIFAAMREHEQVRLLLFEVQKTSPKELGEFKIKEELRHKINYACHITKSKAMQIKF